MKKQFFAALLALMMVAALLPAAAKAADGKIQAGIPTLTVNSSTVAFDGREWWVIGNATTGVHPVANHITLLAKASIGTVAFRTGSTTSVDGWEQYSLDMRYYEPNPADPQWSKPTEYAGSTLQQRMDTLAGGIEKAAEKAAEKALIKPRDLTTSDDILTQGVSAQKYWALSHDEYRTIKADATNGTTVLSNGADWWLRSPYYDDRYAFSVNGSGIDYLGEAFSDFGVRPAFNLDLSSVLFTSAAAGGKSAATAGGGFVGATAPTGTVKFTVQAASTDPRNNFTASTTTRSGNALMIRYENATVGTYDYVSAVIKKGGAVTHYAKLVKPANATGTTTLTLPTGFNATTDTVYVFSEQANGDLFTDFASALRQVATSAAATVGNVTISGTAGTAISSKDVTLTLTGETFNSLSANADVSSWFTNRPTNLSAKIKTAVTAGAASATVTLYGTPATASTAAMAITIPATALTGGTALTVTANANAKYNIAAAPAITTQPVSQTVSEGELATFTVEASGNAPFSYAWQYNVGSGDDWLPVSSAGSSPICNITATTSGMNGYRYRCTVTDSNNASVTSSYATLTVSAPAPAPITIPTTVSPGSTFVESSAPELTVTVGNGLLDFNAEGNYDGIDPSSDIHPRLGTVGAPGADGKVENGSIVITLKQSYLNTLVPGTYRLRVKLKGGARLPAYVETRIVVNAPGSVPKTGDNAMPGLWAGVVLLAGIGLAASALRRKRHSS